MWEIKSTLNGLNAQRWTMRMIVVVGCDVDANHTRFPIEIVARINKNPSKQCLLLVVIIPFRFDHFTAQMD